MPPRLRDGECAAFHIGGRQFLVARLLRELRQLDSEFDDVLFVHIANHRNKQAAIRVGGHADVDVLLVDDFFFFDVDAGIELREDFERRGADFQRDRGDRHLAASLFGLGSETRAQLLEFGDVGAVMLRDMRNRVPRFGEMFGSFAPHAAHRNALDLAPFGKVGKLGLGEMPGARSLRSACRADSNAFRISLDIVFADASTRAGCPSLHKYQRRFRAPVDAHAERPERVGDARCLRLFPSCDGMLKDAALPAEADRAAAPVLRSYPPRESRLEMPGVRHAVRRHVRRERSRLRWFQRGARLRLRA